MYYGSSVLEKSKGLSKMNIVILILVCVAGVMLIAWAVARSGRDNPMRGLGTERQGRGEVNIAGGESR